MCAGSGGLGFQLPLNDFQVADGAGSSEVEFVLAAADVASVSALSSARMCLAVFDGHALAELLSAGGCRGSLAQALLQKLVVGDFDGAATVGSCIRALRPQRARAAGLGGKLGSPPGLVGGSRVDMNGIEVNA